MNTGIRPVGQLTADQIRSVLGAAASAHSLGNRQPWRFHCTSQAIELYADPSRAVLSTDSGDREMLLACGAALLNLRLAVRALDVYPDVRILPRPGAPGLLAVVRLDSRHSATPDDRLLAQAIPRRRTNSHAGAFVEVPALIRSELRSASEIERTWLAILAPEQLPALRAIARHAGAVPPGEQLVIVLGSFQDSPGDRVQAGQALQRVLLTATTAGLSAAFLTEVVANGSARKELRELLGGGLWPQAVLSLGHRAPIPASTRRPLDQVVTYDEPHVPSQAY